jgi:hypothetical protein
MEYKDLTDSEKRALLIIGKNKNVRPGYFARLMWPDAAGWKRSTKAGAKGITKGGGMRLAAGGYLGKLAKTGLIERNISKEKALEVNVVYRLSKAGIKIYQELKERNHEQ